ncbi:MAG: HD domain-containing protein [Actinomycetota bacterium]|nr:HD domain-containing protein [Actinomycetota bacterium]
MVGQQFPSFVGALPLTRRALEFAAERHRGQRREADDAAFILHPLEVAQLLRNRDYPDEIVAAGVLHDSLEETDATPRELEELFGAEVARLVSAVSEPPGEGSYAERKARLRASIADAGPDAAAVYAADKVAKARELRLTLARDWSAAASPGTADKLEHYWASLALLESVLEHHPLVSQLRFELEALATLPPRTS